ncbi:hypothetical protein ISN75_00975 [Dyella marensis]|uniref:hypothetical protein n=1 Tax=Dyella TaxID=231454 RepID=UPI0031E455BA
MSEAGLQIFNADGQTVTVDSTYRNFALRTKGVATTTQASGFSSYVDFQLSGLTIPMIATKSTITSAARVANVGNGNFIFRIYANSDPGAQIPYYIFDVPTPSDSRFGLNVFDGAGNLTFDATGGKYLRVVDFIQWDAGISKSYQPGREYACIFNDYGLRVEPPAKNIRIYGAKINAEVMTSTLMVIETYYGSSFMYYLPQYMVIDVTNY